MLRNDPETRVLILTMHESDPLVREVLAFSLLDFLHRQREYLQARAKLV
jgi:hypothetical protein